MRPGQIAVVLFTGLLLPVTSCVAQEAPRTVGELLDKGGSQLDQRAVQMLLSGATIIGDFMQGLPGEKLEMTYAKDGTVKGFLGSTVHPAAGIWEVTDQGRLCSVLRDETNTEHRACTFWFRLGSDTYATASPTPGSVIFLRRVSR